MLDDNGQPVNVTALLADLKKERSTKAALEEKNAGLRKRVQRMLIENDEVRVKAKNEVVAAHHREIAEAQNQLAVYAHNHAYTTELRSLYHAAIREAEGLAKFLQTTESMYLQAYINFLKDMGKKKRYAKTVAVINANA
ncbi:hypothetical protein PPTG_15743 [Phytophthora nicotianae INRA-310]|uniref:Uncharacterized protein n=1 Tax=Phytophthora nicotianae (strain INRA-310) TaxID=761204 RepID=W2PRH3_PHYN3|nr:hypothetical protein PPTG_15743 [Phytophthora nicotianae INRA-310]ETN03522.1 hypothetical protein PPTG_15743 [Phytophthora nicotianae INRA-310]